MSGTAFLTKVISAGIHRWTFRIINISDEMNFGIYKVISRTPATLDLSDRFFSAANNGYAYEAKNSMDKTASDGNLMKPESMSHHVWKSYGANCKDGDIVEMILNLEEYTLSFKVNDIDYGVAFEDIEKTKYRAAIFMYVYGSNDHLKVGCIELIQ